MTSENATTTSDRGSLVLSRRFGESIRIGDDIVVTVVGLGSEKVRIRITAPKSVTVHRNEVYLRSKEQGG